MFRRLLEEHTVFWKVEVEFREMTAFANFHGIFMEFSKSLSLGGVRFCLILQEWGNKANLMHLHKPIVWDATTPVHPS